MGEELAHIKPDAACANHRNLFANGFAITQDINVVQDLWVCLAGNLRIARQHTGCDDDLVVTLVGQGVRIDRFTQDQLDLFEFQLALVIVHKANELFLARYLFCHVELPANLLCLIKKRHMMSTLCSDQCG